jgi:SecD/SecF fusion protein
MNKAGIWKWIILVALVSWSLMMVTPIDQKVKLGLDLRGGTSFTLEIDDSELEGAAKKEARQRALEIIRNRIDGLGLSEPIIYPVPDSNRIVVQMPGLKEEDRDETLQILEQKAFLEFRMVHPENDELVTRLFREGLAPEGYRIYTHSEQTPNGQLVERDYYRKIETAETDRVQSEKIRQQMRRFEAPPGYEFMLEEEELGQGVVGYRPYFVHRTRELTGEYITSASVDYQTYGQPIVKLKLDSEGKRRFRNVTKDYAPGGEKNPSQDEQRFLAIVLDGTLYSAPWIKTPIYNGEAVIEGSFALPEAQRLATVLQAGSLPTPIDLVEERGVDPSLGRDSIISGKRSAIFAGLAVVVFMLIYYMGAGVIANLALLLDILLLPLGMLLVSGFLSFFTGDSGMSGGKISLPTLTLPGIAGIVLTIGMAVDANVLIFERIREEQRAGKRLLAAVSAGYEKAFSTIFDANITTLLTAVILFWQGVGPVRGFAITLSAGIIVSMYTALVVTRMLFNLVGEHSNIKQIKMLQLVRDTNIDFLNKRKVCAVISGLIIIATWVAFIQKGSDNFGVDFTGGSSLTFAFEERVAVEQLRDTLAAAGISDALIQYQDVLSGDAAAGMDSFLELKVGHEEGDLARQTVAESFSEQGYRNIKTDSVGPQVGEELKRKGVYAMVFAFIGIVIYISLRFEFAFAMGAIVAVLHDVLITIGLFCLLGNQLSLPIVAALLTIVGYSVNDTIVVFDRIREDLKLMKGRPYKEICNISINQTLSRTLLTSITTLLSVTILLFFGGGAIQDFALALFIGVIVGTYSSIFIATPVVLFWHKEGAAKAEKAKS